MSARAAGRVDATYALDLRGRGKGHYHDLLADIGKEQVLSDITAWIDSRLPRA